MGVGDRSSFFFFFPTFAKASKAKEGKKIKKN
jgi:hypothetical protein